MIAAPYNLGLTDLESNNTETQNVYFKSKIVKIFDYSIRGNYIAFLNPKTDKINVTHINITEESGILEKIDSVIINNKGKPICLTIDWIHDLLYWLDIKSHTINVVNILKPELNLLLINLNEDEEVTTLVVNPMKSSLVWIKKRDSFAIMTSFQDGSNIRILYQNRVASHLTIDFETERYYFIAENNLALYSINFQGTDELLCIHSNILPIVNDMSLLGDDLYLSIDEALVRLPKISQNPRKIDLILMSSKFNYSENLFNFSLKSHNSDRQEIYRVKIVNPLLQPNFTNKCESTNCSYLCLPSGNIVGFRCICPTNSSSNLSNCEIHKQNLIVRTTTERITFKTARTERVMTTYRSTIRTTDMRVSRTQASYRFINTNRNEVLRTTSSGESMRRIRTELNTESMIKNSESAYEERNSKNETSNIHLMFVFIMIGFFVLALIITVLIISNFRYDFYYVFFTRH